MTDQEFSDFISKAIQHNEASIKYAEEVLLIIQSPLWRGSPGAEASIKKFKESVEYHRTAIRRWQSEYRKRFGVPVLNS